MVTKNFVLISQTWAKTARWVWCGMSRAEVTQFLWLANIWCWDFPADTEIFLSAIASNHYCNPLSLLPNLYPDYDTGNYGKYKILKNKPAFGDYILMITSGHFSYSVTRRLSSLTILLLNTTLYTTSKATSLWQNKIL